MLYVILNLHYWVQSFNRRNEMTDEWMMLCEWRWCDDLCKYENEINDCAIKSKYLLFNMFPLLLDISLKPKVYNILQIACIQNSHHKCAIYIGSFYLSTNFESKQNSHLYCVMHSNYQILFNVHLYCVMHSNYQILFNVHIISLQIKWSSVIWLMRTGI